MKLDRTARVLLIAEELSRRPDEAALSTLAQLARYCTQRFSTLVLHCRGEAPDGLAAERIRFTRVGITPALWKRARDWRSDLVIYVPSASITANAFYRARCLGVASRAPVAVVGLQRRRLSSLGRVLARMFEPDALIVSSETTAGPFRQLGWSTVVMDLGVDSGRFQPVSPAQRDQIRAELGWADLRPVVLHVGHLRSGRGLEVLAAVAADGRYRVVMIASESERGEEHLAADLRSAGVDVHHGFVEKVERFYQASDLYLFPVANETSAVDFPLSVLEALACGRPVLTTRHGALPERLADHDAVHWLDSGRSVADQVDSCLQAMPAPAEFASAFGWDAVFERMIEEVQEALT